MKNAVEFAITLVVALFIAIITSLILYVGLVLLKPVVTSNHDLIGMWIGSNQEQTIVMVSMFVISILGLIWFLARMILIKAGFTGKYLYWGVTFAGYIFIILAMHYTQHPRP